MKYGLMTLTLAFACVNAAATDAPALQQDPVAAGQTWTYKRITKSGAGTVETRTIFRLAARAGGGDRYVIESLPAQLTGRPSLWHKSGEVDANSCMVDFFGTGSLGILNSCATTFEPGMDWTTESTVKGVKVAQHYQVLDTETIDVAAGSFQAIRIEARWQASKGKAGGKPTHRIVYWYAPETRSMVKVQREFLNSKGAVESETVEELERFRQNIAR